MGGVGTGPGELLMLAALALAWSMAMVLEWPDLRRRRQADAHLVAAAQLVRLDFRRPDELDGDTAEQSRIEAA
jgi:hypothetical protein